MRNYFGGKFFGGKFFGGKFFGRKIFGRKFFGGKTNLMEQPVLDTNAGKQLVLGCHSCQINTGAEKTINI